jgi:polysaccharide biosynthesis/export protein
MANILDLPGISLNTSNMCLKNFYTLTLACLLGLLTGCSSNNDQITSKPDAIQAASATPTFAPKPTQEYRIQAGDQLEIKFYHNPELNDTFTVRPDGNISLLYIGDVSAAGSTPADLSRIINQKYAGELRKPSANVALKTFTMQRVFIGGEVQKQGAVPLTQGMNAMQAIFEAGGFKETATAETVLVIRRGSDNKPVPASLNLRNGNTFDLAFQLQPQDIVYVPRSKIANADKFMKEHVRDLLLFNGASIFYNPTP